MAGQVNANGTINTNNGRYPINTPTHTVGSGVYQLSWATAAPTTTYSVFLAIRNGTGMIQFNGQTTTSVNIYTYSAAGAAADQNFSFMLFP